MDKRYQDTGAAGCQWGAGQEAGGRGNGSRAGEESPSDVLRCGTLVLTGFPVPQPKDRPAPPPAAPAKSGPAATSD